MREGEIMDINFLNGIYYIKAESLLGEDDFNALKRFDKNLFLKYLKTRNFGYRSKYSFLEEVVVQEVINVKEELLSLTQDAFLKDAIYCEHDITNIKMAYKSVKYNIPMATYDRIGSLSVEALLEFFKNGNDKLIPEYLRNLLSSFKESDDTKEYMQEIERKCYDFYEEQAKKKKIYRPMYTYLQLQKVAKNVQTLLKLRIRQADLETFKDAILIEEQIGINNWYELYELSDQELIDKIYILFDEKMASGVEDFIKTRDPNYFNDVLIQYLEMNLKVLSYDYDSVGPIIYYLFLKNLEIMKVRTLYYDK